MKAIKFQYWQNTSIFKNVLLLASCGIIFYVCVFYSGTKDKGFVFVEQNIGSFHGVQELVGDVHEVKLDPIGGFSDKFYGSHSVNHMIVDIEGSKATIQADVVVESDNDIWKFTAITVDGKPIKIGN